MKDGALYKIVVLVTAIALVVFTVGCDTDGEDEPDFTTYFFQSAGAGTHMVFFSNNQEILDVFETTGDDPDLVTKVSNVAGFAYRSANDSGVDVGTYTIPASDPPEVGDLFLVSFIYGETIQDGKITARYAAGHENKEDLFNENDTIAEYDKIESGWLKIESDNANYTFTWRLVAEDGTVLSGSYSTPVESFGT